MFKPKEINLLILEAKEVGSSKLKPEAVSYTHLDVYKRQGMYWLNEKWKIEEKDRDENSQKWSETGRFE